MSDSSPSPLEHSHLLKVDSLAFERNDSCLFENLNLVLEAGEIVQVEGANGSGKTTYRLLTTALQPRSDISSTEVLW